MNYCHLTDATWNPRPLPSRFGEISENYQNSDPAQILKDGWRVAVPATVEAGARYASAVTFTDTEAREVVAITATAAEVAAEKAASEAARLETPIVFDQPLQARIEIVAHDAHVYGVEVDPVAGELVPVQRESTRLTAAEYAAARAAKIAARASRRAAIAAIKTDLEQVQAAIDTIDQSAIVPANIVATAGVWADANQRSTISAIKTAIVTTKQNVGDLKTACRNLMQAVEKIRRDIR